MLCFVSLGFYLLFFNITNSCIKWSPYIKAHLTVSTWDGQVRVWDACTSQQVCSFAEHEKRAWSVDYSSLDPSKIASASDDTRGTQLVILILLFLLFYYLLFIIYYFIVSFYFLFFLFCFTYVQPIQ